MIPYLDRAPARKGKVSAVFVPYYLDGHDPLFGKTYYDLLIGMDITVFPSYYEPWGYTPLESCAFHVPTITTSLAGFGAWAARQKEHRGVTVIERNDSNFDEVAEQVAETMLRYDRLTGEEKALARKEAEAIAKRGNRYTLLLTTTQGVHFTFLVACEVRHLQRLTHFLLDGLRVLFLQF